MNDINQIINHLRMPFMSGIERSKTRIKKTHEFFTPSDLVIKINEWLDDYDPTLFTDTNKTFMDHSCGDGQILSEVLIRKLEKGSLNGLVSDSDFKQALSTIYGVDLMMDNVELCRDRLLCGREDLRDIVQKNIVCHDALTYDYSFNGHTKKNGHAMTDKEVHHHKLGIDVAPPPKQPKTKKTKTAPVIGNLFE